MRILLVAVVLLAAMLAVVYSDRLGQQAQVVHSPPPQTGAAALPERAVLDISVHTLEELVVLLERAEVLAAQQPDAEASVVLVLHGPEVEFFSTRNYARYRDVVDQAARLDAMEIVDVRICQTMMARHGIARDDIPPFIEQVPDGVAELEQLVDEGYVYF